MVIRVALLLFCLVLTALAPVVHPGTAVNTALAYSAACPPPPSCAPPSCPPPSCGPPSCGSGLGGPGSLCGACLSICSGCCATLIGIPAAIMQGILAPPRVRQPQCGPTMCPPRTCGPTMCPPPMCGPPQCAPQPITKCKPMAYGPPAMPYGYAPAAAHFPPIMMPAAPQPTASFYIGPPVENSGLSNMVSQLVQIPFNLVSGTLTAPGSPWGQDLFATPQPSSVEATFGGYW
jgi:hypothetical protein